MGQSPCAAIHVRFPQESLPYTNEQPGGTPLAIRPVSECNTRHKTSLKFCDELSRDAHWMRPGFGYFASFCCMISSALAS